MNKIKKWALGALLYLGAACSCMLPACGGQSPSSEDAFSRSGQRGESPFAHVRLHAPGDLVLLAQAIGANTEFSTSSLADLREGKCDAALVGRDLTKEDLTGLQDYIIAQDALCIVIDENSYIGYEPEGQGQADPILLLRAYKTEGLRDLSSDDLKGFLTFWTQPPGQRWVWKGDYYYWAILTDEQGEPIFEDFQSGKYAMGWVRDFPDIVPRFNLIPGTFDTQAVLYERLHLDENTLVTLSSGGEFVCPRCTDERQTLSGWYRNAPPFTRGHHIFVFQIAYVSRSIMGEAMQHLPIRVVSIEGMDPLADPTTIYNGAYPFARKIHLVVREGASEAEALGNWLISPEGQKFIAGIGFLPLSQSE